VELNLSWFVVVQVTDEPSFFNQLYSLEHQIDVLFVKSRNGAAVM
jgi:hypothetical protein